MRYLWLLGVIAVLTCTHPSTSRSQSSENDAATLAGTVAETMDGGRYTYIRVSTGGSSQWIAASKMDVSVGDQVTVHGGTTMVDFKSPALNRTFDNILFSENVEVGSGIRSETTKLPPGHPPISGHGGDGSSSMVDSSNPGITGEIIETMDAGNYTYIQVRASDRTIWAATERFPAKIGERVTVPGGMVMRNFESPTLKRTFDEIYFADYVAREDAGESAPAAATAAVGSDLITQPAGALTVVEIHSRRTELAGQVITVKGKVVKYTEKVMGKNWLHVSDGTGKGEDGDLTISTSDTTALGSVVTAKGLVVVDEDLGYGYKYSVLLKDASLSAE